MNKFNKLVNQILTEVIGPNSPSDDSLPVPQKDYKGQSSEVTPDMIREIQKRATSPKAVKDITVGFLLQLEKQLEGDTQYWKPFVERLLKENKSQSLKDLLESAPIDRLKSLTNILLLTGKSIFIKLNQEQNAQVANQLHQALMQLFK